MVKCPGQDSRYWTPEDFTEKECSSCGYKIEFIKTDLMRSCPRCGKTNVNPGFNLSCAEWCDSAEMCLGYSAGVFGKTDTIKETIENDITDKLDAEEKINHTRKITQMAEKIGMKEKVNMLMVYLTSLCHVLLEEGEEGWCEKIMKEKEIPPEVIETVKEATGGNNIFADILHDAHLLAGDFPESKNFKTDTAREIGD